MTPKHTEPAVILAECLEALAKAEKAAVNDAAFRKQYRLIAEAPAVKYALAKARAPTAEEAEQPPKPARKRTTKPNPVD